VNQLPESQIEANRLRANALREFDKMLEYLNGFDPYLADRHRPTFHIESIHAIHACLAPIEPAQPAAVSRAVDVELVDKIANAVGYERFAQDDTQHVIEIIRNALQPEAAREG